MNRISVGLLGFLAACTETWGDPSIEATPPDRPILVGMRQGIEVRTGAREKMMLRSDGAPVMPTNVQIRVWPPGILEPSVDKYNVWLEAKRPGTATVVITGDALGTSSEVAFTAHAIEPSSIEHSIDLAEGRELRPGERIDLATGFEYSVGSRLLYADGTAMSAWTEATMALTGDGYRRADGRSDSGFVSSKTARTISLPTRGTAAPAEVTFIDPAKVTITWGPEQHRYREGVFHAVRADGSPLELPREVRGTYDILTPDVCSATHKWSHPEDQERTPENGLLSDVFNAGKVRVGRKNAAPAGVPCRVRVTVNRGELPPLAIETSVL
jgi:hypothetical protein